MADSKPMAAIGSYEMALPFQAVGVKTVILTPENRGTFEKVLEKAKYSMDAPANVLLYLLSKEAEARNMRVALVCVAGGLDREFGRRLLSNGR